MTSALSMPSVGFIPDSFPRDPTEFNAFPEHMAIGQILETLVSADRYGNVVPAVAESWQMSDKGKTIEFSIDPKIKFSNGRSVVAEDVVYSLSRHNSDSRSQSAPLLENVEAIEAVGSHVVRLRLKRPQVAIFKVLSRDQLGIVPKGWVFDKASAEPYVGTGVYRLIKNGDEWHYRVNDLSAQAKAAKIREWKLVFAKNRSSLSTLPVYMPILTPNEIEEFSGRGDLNFDSYSVSEFLSFVQSSAWWNPQGTNYEDKNHKEVKMGMTRKFLAERAKMLDVKQATGVIPFGVAGFLPEPVPFAPITAEAIKKIAAPGTTSVTISIGVSDKIKLEIFDVASVASFDQKNGTRFNISSVDISKASLSELKKYDIIVGRWAGGFNDPEGFMPIVTDVIRLPLRLYLGDLYSAYEDASSELDWSIRAEKFREFNRSLVSQERMVPGWRTPLCTALLKGYRQIKTNFRYTPRLMDVSPE